MSQELPKAYVPSEHEPAIAKRELESGYYTPENLPGDRSEVFSIVLPPPNATGTLHMGHAAMLAIQDIMVRFARMQGKKTMWLPGTDHAAIATQVKVEKILMKEEEKSRFDLGRGPFLERVDAFVEGSRSTIQHQVREMGCSIDWTREAFTLDEQRNFAVRTMFKKMYDDGLIYRGYRVINWDPVGQTVISNDELVPKERQSKLYTFKYSKEFPITIATTRPETKVGDTAVAVHPEDARYKDLIGKTFDVTFAGADLKITVIADAEVDPEFGTGALGVTPAHSVIDEGMAKRHDIGMIQVIGEDAKMTDKAGSMVAGLPVLEAREKIVEWLRSEGLMENEEDTVQMVSTAERTGAVIEPLPKLQWFVDVEKEFAFNQSKKAPVKGLKDGQMVTIKSLLQHAVRSKEMQIIPERFEKTYFHWVDNYRPWCISRQLWYGHRIPAWTKKLKKPLKITLIRHGESAYNAKGLGAGHDDPELSEAGVQATELLAKNIDGATYDAVFASDLKRAKQTAEILFGGTEVQADPRLREVDYGTLTGKPTEEVHAYRVSGFPEGERYQDLRARLLEFLMEVSEEHAGGHIAIVAHSGTRKVLDHIVNGVVMSEDHLKSTTSREPMEYTLNEVVLVGVEAPEGEGWEQDPDTLDTWFSAGMWTYSTMGWPDTDAPDLQTYHPSNVMETGYDILPIWVVRMVFMSLYTLGEMPFKYTYLHGLVRDDQGRKMSKSLDNIIDPLEMKKLYGADATRLSLVIGSTPGNDVKLSEEKISSLRNFTNKLWNISRFVLMSAGEPRMISEVPTPKTDADAWILSRLSEVIGSVTDMMDAPKFMFSQSAELLREFTWTDFADWYVEVAKVQLQNDETKTPTEEILLYTLQAILKMYHPFIPFVTNRLWDEFGSDEMLLVSAWPETFEAQGGEAFGRIKDIVVAIRNLRATYKVEPAKKVNVSIAGESLEAIDAMRDVLAKFGRIEELTIDSDLSKPEGAVSAVAGGCTIYLPLGDMIDVEAELTRLKGELDNVATYAASLEKKLSNDGFVKNAPEEAIAKERQKLAEAATRKAALEEQLKTLGA